MNEAHRGGFGVKFEVFEDGGVDSLVGVGACCAVFQNVGGINWNSEVDMARNAVEVVNWLVSRRLGVDGAQNRQMPAGGEPEHADFFGVDAPFFGVAANVLDGSLSVLPGGAVDFHPSSPRNPVFQKNGRNALLFEHVDDCFAHADAEVLIPAAGTDNHAGVSGFLFRLIDREFGSGKVALFARRQTLPDGKRFLSEPGRNKQRQRRRDG